VPLTAAPPSVNPYTHATTEPLRPVTVDGTETNRSPSDRKDSLKRVLELQKKIEQSVADGQGKNPLWRRNPGSCPIPVVRVVQKCTDPSWVSSPKFNLAEIAESLKVFKNSPELHRQFDLQQPRLTKLIESEKQQPEKWAAITVADLPPGGFGVTTDDADVLYQATLLVRSLKPEAKVPGGEGTKHQVESKRGDFGSAFSSGSGGGNLHTQDALTVASQYLNYAQTQLQPLTANAIHAESSKPKVSKDLGPELQSSINKATQGLNVLDASTDGLATSLKNFNDVVNSNEFQQKAPRILGNDATDAVNSSVLAADSLAKNPNGVSAASVNLVGGLYDLKTGLSAPTCVACLADDPSAAPSGDTDVTSNALNVSAEEWVAMARRLASDTKASEKPNAGTTLVSQGAVELEKLLTDLRTYKAQSLLNEIRNPQTPSMSELFNSGAKVAIGQLAEVARRKPLAGRDLNKAERQRVKASALATLQKLRRARNPAGIENALREFFSDDLDRAAWRKTDKTAYQRVRSGTAQIIMARRLALLSQPYFDAATPERVALAYLVQQSFREIEERRTRIRIDAVGVVPSAPSRSPAVVAPAAPALTDEVD